MPYAQSLSQQAQKAVVAAAICAVRHAAKCLKLRERSVVQLSNTSAAAGRSIPMWQEVAS